MSDVVIFGGTTEGRLLAEYCAGHQIHAVVCVVSEYGNHVLPESPYLQVRTNALDAAGMEALLKQEQPSMVMDATHPYAANATVHIGLACEQTNIPYIRISRRETAVDNIPEQGRVLWVEHVDQAVEQLGRRDGTVLVTTGSKELKAYTKLPNYQERIYARVLPGIEILQICREIEILQSHIIAMQGPFSKEMNVAILKHIGAKILVTKEAGGAGGFIEKVEAAIACGVDVIVIGRPKKPEGISLEDGIRRLEPMGRRQGKLRLIGIGMGGSRQLTMEAMELLKQSDVILGADRMLNSISQITYGIEKIPYYLSHDVLQWLEEHQDKSVVSVVYSGDTGFYSGASKLLSELKQPKWKERYDLEVLPGISTVSYLCAKLGVNWEDAYLSSAHGRSLNVTKLVQQHKKVFLLLGGEDSVQTLCQELADHGYPGIQVSVGEQLSYGNQRVITGTAKDMAKQKFHTLAAVLLRNEEQS